MNINEEVENGGTNLLDALKGLREKVFSPVSSQIFTLIVLSDGGDNSIELLEGDARQKALRSLVSVIPDAKALHLHTYTIGLGSLEGGIIPHVSFEGHPVNSSLQEDVLKSIADTERGRYYRANDYVVRDLAHDLFEKINDAVVEDKIGNQVSERSVKPVTKEDFIYDLYYQIPLGIALILLMMIYVLPDTRIRRL